MIRFEDFYHSQVTLPLEDFLEAKLFVYRSFYMMTYKKGVYEVFFLGTSKLLEKVKKVDLSHCEELYLIGGLRPHDYSKEEKDELKALRKCLTDFCEHANFNHSLRGYFYQIDLVGEELNIVKRNPHFLIVDDSGTFLKLAEHYFKDIRSEETLVTTNPYNIIETFSYPELRLIISDINMPCVSGIKLVHVIKNSLPVLLMSGEFSRDSSSIIETVANYYSDFIEKSQIKESGFRQKVDSLLSYKKVNIAHGKKQGKQHSLEKHDLLAIGISTGGVQTLEFIFQKLQCVPVPVVILIHMPSKFTHLYCKRLNETYGEHFVHVDHDVDINENKIYIAQGEHHFHFSLNSSAINMKKKPLEYVHGFAPNIDYSFESLAQLKKKICAGVMTGMGKDGAQGLLSLKKAGMLTFTQDEESSIIYGMPKAAYDIEAHEVILTPDQVAQWFRK